MKARIDGITYPVNNGWAIEERQDEQFDSGIIDIIAKRKPAFPSYRYAELIEDKSVLEFHGNDSRASKLSDTGTIDIKTMYLDITFNNNIDTQEIIELSLTERTFNNIVINGGKLQILSNAAGLIQLTKTVNDVELIRQTILIAEVDGFIQIYINGEKQAIETIVGRELVTSMDIKKFQMGSNSDDSFDIYDMRISSLAYDELTILGLSDKSIQVDNIMIESNTEFIYNEFDDKSIVKNRGFYNTILRETDMSVISIVSRFSKRWNMFTVDPSSQWFDREFEVYDHTIQLIELTAYLTMLKTPYISYKQPLDTTLPLTYETLKDMTDRLFDVLFPELDGVNQGWIYTEELEAILLAYSGFSFDFPEGNAFTVLSTIFNEFAGIPRVTEITNNRLVLGFDYKDRGIDEIEFDDYDAYGNTNPSKDYGTMGESRGINVANDDLARTYMYTKETPITARAVGTVVDEDDMIMQLFYKIKKGFRYVTFIEAGNPINTVDITPFVVSQEEYTTLQTSGFVSGTPNKFKQNCVPYNLKDDKITGWGKTFNRFLLPNFVVWKELIKSAVALAVGSIAVPPADFKSVAIFANYDAILPQTLMRIAKEDISKINRVSTMQTTQGGSLIDIKKAGIQLHSDTQRSANGIINYTKKVNNDVTKMYNIGVHDNLTKSLMTYKKTIGYEDNYVGVYVLNENYSKLTSNLDISAKVRVYAVPEDGKAIESSRYYEDYIEWNLEGIEENTSSITEDGIKAFVNTFGNAEVLIKYEVDNVEMISNEIVDELGVPRNLIVPVNPMPYRNTLKLNFAFNDPTFSYARRVPDGTLEIQEGVRYTDNLGFLDLVSLVYGKKYDTTNLINVNDLPVVSAPAYSGNPLINVGAAQTLSVNIPLPVYQYVNNDESVVRKTASIGANVNPNNETKNAYFEYRDAELPSITYLKKEVSVYEVSALGIGFVIGVFEFTPNEVLTIEVNNNIKELAFDVSVVMQKASASQLFAFTIHTSYDQEEISQGTGLKLSKDPGEILIFDYFVHNVFLQRTAEDIGEIIVGDVSMIENVLCGGNLNLLGTELGVYESYERYGKNEKVFAKGFRSDTLSSDVTFGAQNIQFNVPVEDGSSWALVQLSTNKLLFAVNPPRAIGGVKQPARKKVSFNFTHFRSGLIRNK